MLPSILKLLMQNRLLKIGALMTIMSGLAGLLGYVFQVVVGNILSASDFAIFTAVMGLFAVIVAPLGTITMFLAREVARMTALVRLDAIAKLYRKFLLFVFILSTLLAILSIGMESQLNEYLKYNGNYLGSLLALMIFLSALMAVNIGYLQGMQKFAWLAGINGIQILLKIVIVITLVWFFDKGLGGALLGTSSATLFAWLIGFLIISKALKRVSLTENLDPRPAPKLGSILPVIVANISFAIMTQADMVLVNYHFSPEIAGEYAAASILGKAVLYLPGGIVLALLPMVSEKHAKSEKSSHMVFQAAIATFGICLFVACCYWMFAEQIIELLFGNKFQHAYIFLSVYGFAILPMAMVLVAEYFLIAKGKVLFSYIFLGTAPAQVLAVNYLKTDALSVIFIVGLSCAFVMLIGYALLIKSIFEERLP